MAVPETLNIDDEGGRDKATPDEGTNKLCGCPKKICIWVIVAVIIFIILLIVIGIVIFFMVYNKTGPVDSQGKFHSFAHGVKSGQVTFLDDKTILIRDFYYDGTGPAAWFLLGKGNDYTEERVKLKGVTVIPDENANCEKLKKYENKTFQLTLPQKWTFKDFDYLAIYCLEFHHNFGYVSIPSNLNVQKGADSQLTECKTKWT